MHFVTKNYIFLAIVCWIELQYRYRMKGGLECQIIVVYKIEKMGAITPVNYTKSCNYTK